MTFPASPTFGQIHSEGTGLPSFVYRDAGGGTGVWQNVGMGYGYGPVTFTATPGQTTINVAYQVGAVDIYVEGARLLPDEFTATNGTSIVMAIPFVGGEKGVVIPHQVLSTLEGLKKSLNLSDLPSVDTALTNLGFSTIGKTLRAVASEAAGRDAILAAAKPQTAAGVGQWVAINNSGGLALSLPAGGTWAWFLMSRDASSNALAGICYAGVAAGGTVVGAASAGVAWQGFAWRIA